MKQDKDGMIRINKELYKEVEAYSSVSGKTMKQIAEKAIEGYMKNVNKGDIALVKQLVQRKEENAQ